MVKKLSRYDAATPKEAKKFDQKLSLRKLVAAQTKKRVKKLREVVDSESGEVRRRRGVRTQMRSIRRMLEHIESKGGEVDEAKRKALLDKLAELEARKASSSSSAGSDA